MRFVAASGYKTAPLVIIPYYNLFNPTTIPGCSLWLDGTDINGNGTATANGVSVTTWVDKSRSGNNATTATTAPTYNLSSKSVSFATNQGLVTSYSANPTNESAFIVVNFTSTASTSDLLSGLVTGVRQFTLYSGTLYLNKLQSIPSGAVNGGTVIAGTRYLLEYVYTPSAITFFTTGAQITTGTPQYTYSTNGSTYIGTNSTGNYLNGTISEILVFNQALTATNRQTIESYLAQKWNLTLSPQNTLARVRPAGAPPAVPAIVPFVYSISRFVLLTLSTYALRNISNAVSASSGTPAYIWAVAIPQGSKGRTALLSIFFNLYSNTPFVVSQAFEYGIYIDGVAQGFGDSGVLRYVHTASTNYAMNYAGIAYGTNSITQLQPIFLPLTIDPKASQIQIGLRNSSAAIASILTATVAYTSNNTTTTGTAGTPATFFPQTLFTASGTYTVPSACSAGSVVGVFIYCWGGGGGTRGTLGGAGGFVSGFYNCAPGTIIPYIVNGGRANANQGTSASISGGYTGAFVGAVVNINAILVAGGGGSSTGGVGGYPTGGTGTAGGNGGTQTAVGAGFNGEQFGNSGGPLLGVSTYSVAPGGGGWYGGGGGGGGGSSYLGSSLGASPSPAGIGPSVGLIAPTFANGSGSTPGGTGSPYYAATYGIPGAPGTGGIISIVPAIGANPMQVGVSATLYST